MNRFSLFNTNLKLVCKIFFKAFMSNGAWFNALKCWTYLQLLSGATFLGAVCCFGAFCFKSLYGFIALFMVGEILVFATQVPQ